MAPAKITAIDQSATGTHIVLGPEPLIVGTPSLVIEKDRHLWG